MADRTLVPRISGVTPTRRDSEPVNPNPSPRASPRSSPRDELVAVRERAARVDSRASGREEVTSRELLQYLREVRGSLSAQLEGAELRIIDRLSQLSQFQTPGSSAMDADTMGLLQSNAQAQVQTTSKISEIHHQIVKLSAQNMGLKQAFLTQQEGTAAELQILKQELTEMMASQKAFQEAARRRDEERERREQNARLQAEDTENERPKHVAHTALLFGGSPTPSLAASVSPAGAGLMSPGSAGMERVPSLADSEPYGQAPTRPSTFSVGEDRVAQVPLEAVPVGGELETEERKAREGRVKDFHHAMGWSKPRLFGVEYIDPRAQTEFVAWLASNASFQLFCNFIVVLNVLFLAMETNDVVQYKLQRALYAEGTVESEPPLVAGIEYNIYQSFEWVFLVWMALELAINLWADRGYKGHNRNWNIFDTAVLAASALQVFLEKVNLSFLRIVRVGRAMRFIRLLRIAKIMKIMRLFKYLHSIRKMILSMIGSATSLFWALFLMFIIMFMISVGILQGIEIYLDVKWAEGIAVSWAEGQLDNETVARLTANGTLLMGNLTVEEFKELTEDQPSKWSLGLLQIPEDFTHMQALDKLYGDILSAMLTLFAPISGGAEWAMVAKPVSSISPVFTLIWLIFVSAMLFGVLNILTGIFVDAAMAAAQNDRDNIIEKELEEQASVTNELRSIFQSLDHDHSGYVSAEEFAMLLEDKKCLALFSHLGLHPTEAAGLYKLLDEDESGSVAIDEFVSGCIRLKGGAKAVDMITLLYENRRLVDRMQALKKKMDNLCAVVEQSVGRKLPKSGRVSPKGSPRGEGGGAAASGARPAGSPEEFLGSI